MNSGFINNTNYNPTSMNVIKATGKRAKFNPKKIEGTLYRIGAPEDAVKAVIEQISNEVYDGITTKKVYRRVLQLLDQYHPRASACYSLREAIMRLGPAGFPFETYLARVLNEHGYKTKLRTKLKGKCVTHEIDIIIEKDGVRAFIEAKFRNAPGMYIDLKETMYTYARFLDLNNGKNPFDEVWMGCNTKASQPAKNYAECMGIKILCWHHPPGKGLESLVESKNLYPVTALRNIDKKSVDAFSKAGYMLMKDLIEEDYSKLQKKTMLPKKKLNMLIKEAELVCPEYI